MNNQRMANDPLVPTNPLTPLMALPQLPQEFLHQSLERVVYMMTKQVDRDKHFVPLG